LKPLTMNDGQIEQMASGTALDVGGWNLPTVGGTEDYVLMADSAGHAVWAEVFSDFGDPTADNQILVSTGAGSASWADYLDELTIRNAGNDIAQLGSELVTNGNFTTNLNGWTAGANWAWESSEAAEHTAGSEETLYQGITTVVGETYQVEVTQTKPIGGVGAVLLTFGSAEGSYSLGSAAAETPATTIKSFKAVSTTSNFTLTPTSAYNGKIDTVTVKQVTGVSDILLIGEDNDGTDSMEVRANGTLANIFVGLNSGQNNLTGVYNTAFGDLTLEALTNGTYNDAFGFSALKANTNGDFNTSFGNYSLVSNTIGGYNIAVGHAALHYNSSGYSNTAIGFYSMRNLTTGSSNVALGAYAGYQSSLGSSYPVRTNIGCVFLGSTTKASNNGVDYEVVIGCGAEGRGTGTIVLGGVQHISAHLPNDNMKLYFGEEDDYSAEWDGTNAVHTISSGKFSFVGGNIETSSAIIGSNIPSPTVDDQVLISTAAGIAAWSTAGNDQYLASDGSGEVAWANKPFGSNIPANSAANEVYVGTGAGTAAWTTDLAGLTSLTVDNITIDAATITSDTGAISFGDEDLTTTGTLTADNAVLTGGIRHYHDDTSYSYTKPYSKINVANPTIGTCVIDLPIDFASTLLSIKLRGYNYSAATGPWEVLIGGYAYDSTLDRWVNYHASVQGEVPFTSIRLGYNGNTSKACIMLGETDTSWALPMVEVSEVLAGGSQRSGLATGWDINWYTVETNFYNNTPDQSDPLTVTWNRDFNAPASSGQLLQATGDKVAAWTTDITGLTSLTVDNITINGAVITSDTGAISFGDEDLTTTGTMVGSNIPSPTVDDQVLISTAAGVAAWSTAGNNKVLCSDGSGNVAWIDKPW